jgi:hypothetical protein
MPVVRGLQSTDGFGRAELLENNEPYDVGVKETT